TILNHDEKPVRLKVRIDASSDFDDLFEVKDALAKQGAYSQRARKDTLVLSYARETFQRETVISPGARARIDKTGFTYTVKLEPKGRWSTDIHVVTAVKVGGQQHTFSA